MKKILLVEDDPVLMQRKLKELDAQGHCKIETASSFSELQSFISQRGNEIFIVLLDYHLDGAMNGEAVDYLGECGIPMIVYTEAYSSDLRDTLFSKGVLEYLLKKPNGDLLYTKRLIERVQKNSFIKALVVDGSENFKKELSGHLNHFGLYTLQASDAATAMELLDKHREIKLVIIDLDIEGPVQGIELIEKIREEFPSTELAILGMSPHGYNSLLSIEFLKKGANDFIIKPFVKEQLNLRVMQVLEMIDTIAEKHHEAFIDPLTGVFNRRALNVQGMQMVKEASQLGQSLAVAAMDIDHFKSVNDSYGHDTGDQILKMLASLLRSSFRKDDLVVRNGGEEFCVVLKGVDEEKAVEIFENFRRKVASSVYSDATLELGVTVSIGMHYGLEDEIGEMINSADIRLYRAKHEGRNRLVYQDA